MNYQLSQPDIILDKAGPRKQTLLRDQEDDELRLNVDALVASGDCFVTLATSLDDATKYLEDKNLPTLSQVEATIHTLLYLQRHYKISRKPSEYRQ